MNTEDAYEGNNSTFKEIEEQEIKQKERKAKRERTDSIGVDFAMAVFAVTGNVDGDY